MKIQIKTLFLVLYSIVFFFNNVKAQDLNGLVTYKKKILEFQSESKSFQVNKEKRPIYYNNVVRIEQNVKVLLEDLTFNMIFNSDESFFKVEPQLEIENNSYYEFALGPDGNDVHYCNIKQSINIIQRDAYGELFIIEMPETKWELLNDTKQIGGYTCYKATTIRLSKNSKGVIKMPVEVWYTPEISIPYGPIGYNGLPGLIMELTMLNFSYYVEKIELNSEKNYKISKPTRGKNVTKDKFETIGVEQLNDLKRGY